MKIQSFLFYRDSIIITLKEWGNIGEQAMYDNEDEYFRDALTNFTQDFAYGGAIRHLVDRGYTVDMIIKEFHYPLSRESIEKIVAKHLESKDKE